MTRVVVVYHSGYGHTAFLAQAVARGAESVEGTSVSSIPVGEIDAYWDKLDTADAIIFGAPTYMGSVSGVFKNFMEATSRRWTEQKWKDKIAAGFSNSGSLSGDKLNTLIQLAIFAAQHGMLWVGTGLASEGTGPDDRNRVGSYLGVMAQSSRGDTHPSEGDLKTGEFLGQRVATIAKQWAGRSTEE